MEVKIIGPETEKTSGVKKDMIAPIMGMEEQEFLKLAGSVVIMIPHRISEGINANLGQCIGFWSRFGTPVATIEDEFGGFIEMMRAGMVRTFLDYCGDRPEIQYCVMIDADENVPWDAPYRLAAWDLPVVSGVICNYSQTRGIFACFTVKDEYGVARFPSWNFTKSIPARGLVEAHSVGTGLVCIKRNVFETIIESGEMPFVIPEVKRQQCIDSGVLKWGEDIAFSRQCERHGFKRHVDMSVRGVHFKTIPIMWPEKSVDPNIDVASWKVDNRDYVHG